MTSVLKKHLLLLIALIAGTTGTTAQNFALASVAVANVREEPRHASELGSQVVMGTPLRIEGRAGDWFKITTPEGYRGYIIGNSLTTLSDAEMEKWKEDDRIVVSSVDQTYLYETDTDISDTNRLSDVVDGCILQRISAGPEMTKVRIPDGRTGYIRNSDILSIEYWSEQTLDPADFYRTAVPLMGVTYIWGGTTSKGMDCSGLTKIAAYRQGVILPRNASQQVKSGEIILRPMGQKLNKAETEKMLPGDLLFFGNHGSTRINHVGIYMGDGRFIHSSGRVKINSLSEELPFSLLFVTRLTDDNIKKLKAKNSPLYFK